MRFDESRLSIEPEGVASAEMRQLVTDHFEEMVAASAPESSQALDVASLASHMITLYGIRQGDELLGCGAIKELDQFTGEVKTMRIREHARGLGLGGTILDHLVFEARLRGYQNLYLETGSEPFFEPARALYRSRGFAECGPFAQYVPDPHSVFMLLPLG